MMEKQSLLEVFTDGGARGNPGPAACAFVVFNKGKLVYKQGKFLGISTNNKAEYQGVIAALEWLAVQDLKKILTIKFFLDSELVVRQLTGIYKIKNKDILELVQKIKSLEKNTDYIFSYKSVPRSKNKVADALVNETLDAVI